MTHGLCECGCGEATNTKNGKHFRFVAGHQHRKTPIRVIEQDAGFSTPCWIWQGATVSGPYGQLRRNGKLTMAHRAYYEDAHGPIQDGNEVHHLCGTTLCVNPKHLLEMLPLANQRRKGNKKLTPVCPHCKGTGVAI